MKPITISLSPNTESDDVRLAWRVLLQPRLWRNTDIIARLEQQLSAKLNQRSVILSSSGRSALYTLLQAYGIGRGDEVILQAFTCIAVPAAIQWTGAKPVYTDIAPATYNLDPACVRQAVTRQTKAIIVQHTFGIPGPIDELRSLTNEHNILLIEDCAHALGATYHGQPVGTFGDAAILSFGRDKTISSIFGGAIVSADANVITKARELQSKLRQPPLLWIKQQLVHPILINLILPLYFKAHIGKALLVLFQQLGFLSKVVDATEKQGRQPPHLSYQMPGALAYLLQNQLAKLDRYSEHRRRLAKTYRTALEKKYPKTILPTPFPDTNPSWLRFPVLVDNPERLHAKAKEHHILLGNWYDSPLAPADCNLETFGYRPGSCPKAEATARQIINLPTHPSLTEQQAQVVIGLLAKN